MSCAGVLALAVLTMLMKWVAALRTHRVLKGWVFSPLLAPTSLAQRRPRSELPRVLRKVAFLLAGLVLSYWLWWQIIPRLQLPAFSLSYLAVLPLLLLTDFIAGLLALAWLPSGVLLPPFHQNPLAAESISDFWGRRWNLWFSDWFRFVIFQSLRRKPVLAVFMIYFVSGVIHELAINVPLYLVTGRRLIGLMMIYYLLQAIGALVERRLPRRARRLRIVFLWLVVFVPVPLMINEGMLRIMHLWPR
jgi:hypothetical protein